MFEPLHRPAMLGAASFPAHTVAKHAQHDQKSHGSWALGRKPPNVTVDVSRDYRTGYQRVTAKTKLPGFDERERGLPMDFWVQMEEGYGKRWSIRVARGPYWEQRGQSYYEGDNVGEFTGTASAAKTHASKVLRQQWAAWVDAGHPREWSPRLEPSG